VPFLRFSRDKRGYETTSLMHSFRGRGDARPRLLYWYRTPPDVKVGRAALDEGAIRALEENNPELTFDWSRILHSRARPEPADRRPEGRGEGRAAGRPSRPGEAAGPLASMATPPARSHLAEPHAPETARTKSRRRRQRPKGVEGPRLPFSEDSRLAERVPDADAVSEERKADAAVSPPSPVVTSAPVVQVQTNGKTDDTPAAPGEVASHGSALEAISHEDLARLRARYAEIQARISQRVTDPQRLEKLRALAEQLNPDVWVTADEVASGLAEFDAVHTALKTMLGRRRRRSRRGGVRHRRGGLRGSGSETPASPTPEASHLEPGSKPGADDDAGPNGPADEE
jgi:hypothetical protein